MKKIWRFTVLILRLILLLLFLYLLAAFVLSLIPVPGEESDCPKTRSIYVKTNGVHLYFIVPVENLESEFRKKLDIPQGFRYIGFGWGDRGFYLHTPRWEDLTLKRSLHALLLPSATAMHVSYRAKVGVLWRKVQLCPHQSNKLMQYIQHSFEMPQNGLLPLEAEGYGPYNSFYAGNGTYTCFITCNEWVNQGLQQAGVKTSFWSPFDLGVLYHLDN